MEMMGKIAIDFFQPRIATYDINLGTTESKIAS